MKASLKNYRQTPRKTRLVTDLVKGKRVPEALAILEHANKRAAHQVKKLIESAVANALKAGERAEALMVKNITVDKGIVFTRFMARARGSASPIRKRTSRINVMLAAAPQSGKKAPKAKKAAVAKK